MNAMNNMIYVTRPFLPPLEEFIPYLEEIWKTKTVTNGGPYHQQLEDELCKFLGVKYISLFTNGTVALITALQALSVKGEVITTPYSFVATSHSLLWNGIQPVFVDIDPITLNIDPLKIEAAITPKTTAILAVHCYGCPCDVISIEQIARRHNLKVIYDAAHAFAVRSDDNSVLNFGDLSILSFHATKVFNTFEGGAIVSTNLESKQHIDHLKNFGFIDEVTVITPGINGKMSEVNSAFGLLQLKYVDGALSRRKELNKCYVNNLNKIPGIKCVIENSESTNNAYFPIMVHDEYALTRDELYEKLKENKVYARRYFYPLISDLPLYKGLCGNAAHNFPNANDAAKRVLCLPIFPGLSEREVEYIATLIRM